ncbi:hypothetical protein J1N35_025852 [Gossypium stocksii]|uniref:Aminotransferase-like plant mobile domain-containing protein n=1 Tax=Gossypium stocksii TaxID=47602 RepID=A0A9D3V7F4_9ROSI|nr:hypothetical protein J1N35_025852 [Gossypium stocksii]
MFDLKYDLIYTLIKWWLLETHTFHFPCGTCTITLEDVALQLELPIDGSAITSVSIVSEITTICYDLQGCSPSDGGDKLMSLKFSWFKANFEYLPSIATNQKVMCVTRAYIMHMGSAVLATLDHKLCQMTKHRAVDISRCQSNGTTGIEYCDRSSASNIFWMFHRVCGLYTELLKGETRQELGIRARRISCIVE